MSTNQFFSYVKSGFLVLYMLGHISCQSQSRSQQDATIVGGPCDGCEALFEYGDKPLKSIDTLPEFAENTQQIMISGTVYKLDGITPSPGAIIYIYHTDRDGIYAKKGNEKGWGLRHGHYRGWVETDKDGKYSFFTFRPAAYPNGREPEHIHLTVKEPDKNPYYIDSVIFSDDKLMTDNFLSSLQKRGGEGLVNLDNWNGILRGQRDITLGLNIPDYY